MQSAMIREIRRIYPVSHITLIVQPRSLNLAECCPYVDELIPNFSLLGVANTFQDDFQRCISLSSHLLKRRFDVCYSVPSYQGALLLMYMCGARVRVTAFHDDPLIQMDVSANQFYSILATHLLPRFNYGTHGVDEYLSIVDNMLHVPSLNRHMEVWYTPADYSIALSKLQDIDKPIYALNMGGALARKHYPPEKYARLLELILQEEPTATFVILGGGQDDLDSAAIIRNVVPMIYDNNVIDLTNKITYRQSAAVLNLCDIHIGNDTGTVHVAAAAGCPVLTLMCFATDLPISDRDNPQRWYPYNVPSVVVQPKRALPECKNISLHDFRGCAANFPHCITQIEPATLFKGFKLLKERIAKKINAPLYIS